MHTHTFGAPYRAAPDSAIRSVRERERVLVEQLHADLDTSATNTKAMLGLNPKPATPVKSLAAPATAPGTGPSTVTVRLRWATDAAGAAFDLLASHLDGNRLPRTPDGGRLRGGDAGRAAIADAALLARGLAELDARIAGPLRAAADRVPDPGQRLLLATAVDDVDRVTLVGVASYARVVTDMLRSDHRAGVDDLVPAPVLGPTWSGVHSPADAAHAVHALRSWTAQHATDLTITDLMNIAATGARLARLTGLFQLYRPGDHAAAVDAATRSATAWRQAHMGLRALRSVHSPPAGAEPPRQLAAWLDTQLRGENPGQRLAAELADPARAAQWGASIRAITGHLPDLARGAGDSLRAQLETGRSSWSTAP